MEITLYEKMQNPLDAVDRLGVVLAKSGMFGCDNENAGKVLAMICMTERKSPVEILRTFDIIGGKLRKKAQAAYAEFRGKGGKVRWLATGDDGVKAEAEFDFEGNKFTLAFTIDQAKAMGLVKPNSGWTKTPGNMLRARVLSNGVGMLCPEIFAGGDESESSDAPAPVIQLTPAPLVEAVVVESSPVTPTPTPSPVIQATVVAPSPTTQVAEPVAAAPVSQPAAASTLPGLPDEMVAKLEAAIGEHAVIAGKWLIKEGWLKHGEGLAQLSETRANRILKQTASFIRAVTGSANV